MIAAWVNGRSSRTLTTCSAGQTTSSENVPMRAIWVTGSPFRLARAAPPPQRPPAHASRPADRPARPGDLLPHGAGFGSTHEAGGDVSLSRPDFQIGRILLDLVPDLF